MADRRAEPSYRSDRSSRREFLHRAGSAIGAVGLGGVLGRPAQGRTLGANDRIGVGMIGCGGRGSYLLGALKELRDAGVKIELVAVCDVYRPRVRRQAEVHKAKAYLDHRELLADPNVDVVGIATPDHIHGFQVIDAVRAGKDVYCEKPVTHWRQFELTKRMTDEVTRSGRVFQLGSQGMSNPAWAKARELIREGLIGQPIHAEGGYFRVGDWGEAGMPIDDPNAQPGPDLDWEAFLGDSPKRPFEVSRFFRWRLYEDYSGGPPTDLYPHAYTPLVSMLNLGMPRSAVGSGGIFRYHSCKEREVPDTFNILLEYPEKVAVTILGTQGNNYCGQPELGSVGRAPIIRGWEGTITFEANAVVFTPAQGSDKPAKRWPIEQGEDLKVHLQNWLDGCRSRRPTASHVELAYRVQTALQMGILAWRAGKTARFDAEKEAIVV